MATLPGQDKPTDFGQKPRRLDIHHAQHTHASKGVNWLKKVLKDVKEGLKV